MEEEKYKAELLFPSIVFNEEYVKEGDPESYSKYYNDDWTESPEKYMDFYKECRSDFLSEKLKGTETFTGEDLMDSFIQGCSCGHKNMAVEANIIIENLESLISELKFELDWMKSHKAIDE